MKKSFTICILLVFAIPLFSFSYDEPLRKEILIRIDSKNSITTIIQAIERQLPYPSGLALKKKTAEKYGVFLLTFVKAELRDRLMWAARNTPGVLGAQWNEPLDWRGTEPNDSLFSTQWNLQRIQAPDVWAFNTGGTTPDGDEIVVAVLDKGFDWLHEDLKDNVWTNKGEIAGDGEDNDLNGFIDDYRGWNFRNSGSPQHNVEVHGTSVAGIIGAKANNSLGVAGVNWNTKLMLLGVDFPDEVVEAFFYVLEMRQRYNASNGAEGAFIVATNGSFGKDEYTCDDYPVWRDAYDLMGAEGILSVAATANHGYDVEQVGDVPTDCTSDFLVAVTSTDRNDDRQQGAAYGKISIDLGAPDRDFFALNTGDRYRNITEGGTSFATPLVSGAIALIYSFPCTEFHASAMAKPAETALFVKNLLLNSVDPVASMQDETVSGGRLNVFKGLQYLHNYCIASPEDRANNNFFEKYSADRNFIKVYPNPVAHTLYIDYSIEDLGVFRVNVYDAFGRKVIFSQSKPTSIGEKQQMSIDVSDWANGVYTLSVQDTNEKRTWRFLKAK